MSKKHTSYRGQAIDMELLKFQNQHNVALGNANMNARGDIIGNGGLVMKTREELLAESEKEILVQDLTPDDLTVSKISNSVDTNVFDDEDDTRFQYNPSDEDSQEEKVKPKRVIKTKEE